MATQQILGDDHVSFTVPLVIPWITALISSAIFFYWHQNKRTFELGNLLPGPPALPLIGNAHYVIGKNHNGEHPHNRLNSISLKL